MTARTARAIALSAVTLVGLAAFYISFIDIVHAARLYGQPIHVALAYPVIADMGIVANAMILISNVKGVGWRAKSWAMIGRAVCCGFTLAANGLSAGVPQPFGWADGAAIVIRIVPAVILIATVETAIHALRGSTAPRGARRPVRGAGNVTSISRTKSA